MDSASLLCPPCSMITSSPPKPERLFLCPLTVRRRGSLASGFPPWSAVFRVPAVNKPLSVSPQPDPPRPETDGDPPSVIREGGGGLDLGWLPVFPHVVIASMANFLFGYHIGVMNGPIEAIAKELGFDGNSFLEGLVVSIFIAGAFIGSISAASFIDKLGCRRTLQIDTIPLILGAFLSAQAHSLDEILWGRFFVGLGIGVNTMLVPLYISEVSPTRYRGSLGALCQIGTCLGIIASLSLGIPSESDPHWWRTMLYIASAPGFILMFGMQFAVESPRWLCKVGRLVDAKRVIGSIWSESEVESSIKEIQSVTKNDGSNLESSWLELLVVPHNKVAFIGGSLFILQQFSGINGVLYFSSLTFHDVGITNGALASLLVGITNFAGALSALYLMDKQGRKRLLTGSYLGMVHIHIRYRCWASDGYNHTRAQQCPDTHENHELQLLRALDLQLCGGLVLPGIGGQIWSWANLCSLWSGFFAVGNICNVFHSRNKRTVSRGNRDVSQPQFLCRRRAIEPLRHSLGDNGECRTVLLLEAWGLQGEA